MKHWWARKHDIKREDKKRVEYFTGCIPLFLNNCIVKGENGKDKICLETQFFRNVFQKVSQFEINLQAEYKGDEDKLRQYVTVVLPT
jgi:hypothetical protein